MRWVVALTPAVVGVASFALSPTEDFRSSGLMAGVALSIVLAGLVLTRRKPWRNREGVVALAARSGVAVLLVIGAIGLVAGVPEFLSERFGLLLSTDDRGLLAVTTLEGGFVAVGHAGTGAAWTSLDGVSWTPVELPESMDGLDLRSLAFVAGEIWAVGEGEGSGGVLAEVQGLGRGWIVGGSFGHPDHGHRPHAAAGLGDLLLTFGSTYGNDVIFFAGDPRATLEHAGPEPAGDRGYEAEDMACADAACVAVGSHGEPAAAFWHVTDGMDWERVHLDRSARSAEGVAVTSEGWLAVGHDSDGNAVTWRSSDGRSWESDPALAVAEAAFDGLAVDGNMITAFGHDERTDQAALWSLDSNGWTRVELGSPPGSRVRSLTVKGETIVAVGVDGLSLEAAVWVSRGGATFQRISLGSSP